MIPCSCVQFSEGSASREELLVQLARRAEQVQRLEARLGGETWD